MKKVINIVRGSILGLVILFASCSDMLNTDSDMLLFSDDHRLDSANDSLYSVIGILNQLKDLGDRYVVLGELRGDLMDITDNSSIDLQEINRFSVSKDNPYVSTREYYAVINNCNYFLHHADPNMIVNGNRVFYPEIAVVKTIRSWTYMQLVLNYGTVSYFEEPILTVQDSNREYPQLGMSELAEKLIADLTPLIGIEFPKYGNIANRNSSYLFIPVELLLGDLYLWTNRYEEAASQYYNLMYRKSYTVAARYSSSWTNPSFLGFSNNNWNTMFADFSNEVISVITSSSEYGQLSRLYFQTMYTSSSLSDSDGYSLRPSDTSINMWNEETYTYFDSSPTSPTYQQVLTTKGDLRGNNESYLKLLASSSASSSTDSVPMIYKYYTGTDKTSTTLTTNVYLYRLASLYLRYAEAINQTGRPTMALAVLKNGLNEETLRDTSIVAPKEINPMQAYCNFAIPRFDSNVGIRSRGLGDTDKDSIYCVIPQLATIEDSIAYVDDLICKEYALETAFEGNRFHDLMRFALRRNDPSYLARKVAAKHQNDPAIYNKLLNQQNWFLPLR